MWGGLELGRHGNDKRRKDGDEGEEEEGDQRGYELKSSSGNKRV